MYSLDAGSLHEIRESYDVASYDGIYPDDHAPEMSRAIHHLAPDLCKLTIRLLKCMAIALGNNIIPFFNSLKAFNYLY